MSLTQRTGVLNTITKILAEWHPEKKVIDRSLFADTNADNCSIDDSSRNCDEGAVRLRHIK